MYLEINTFRHIVIDKILIFCLIYFVSYVCIYVIYVILFLFNFFLTLHSSKDPETKISKQHIKRFLKDHVTLKTGEMATKNSALHHRNKLHFKNRKQLF